MPASKLDPKVVWELEAISATDRQKYGFLFTEIARIGVACSRVNACLRLVNSLMTRSMSMCATVHGLAGGDDTAIKARAEKLQEIFPELTFTQRPVDAG